MKLVPIDDSHDSMRVLYALLAEREAHQNINHFEMPSFNRHVRFVMSRPYAVWCFVVVDGQKVGAVYLTRSDEIGVFIFKTHRGRGYGKSAVSLLMRENPRARYLANINPKNTVSCSLFTDVGFTPLQVTYEFRSQ